MFTKSSKKGLNNRNYIFLVLGTLIIMQPSFADKRSLYDLKPGDWITYQPSDTINDAPTQYVKPVTLKDTDLKIRDIQSPGLFQIPTNSKIGDYILVHAGYLSCACPVTGIKTITVGKSNIQSFEVKTEYGAGKDNNGNAFTGTIDNFYDRKTGLMLQSSQEFTMFGVHQIIKIIATNASPDLLGENTSISNVSPFNIFEQLIGWLKQIFHFMMLRT